MVSQSKITIDPHNQERASRVLAVPPIPILRAKEYLQLQQEGHHPEKGKIDSNQEKSDHLLQVDVCQLSFLVSRTYRQHKGATERQ